MPSTPSVTDQVTRLSGLSAQATHIPLGTQAIRCRRIAAGRTSPALHALSWRRFRSIGVEPRRLSATAAAHSIALSFCASIGEVIAPQR
jgi:hypothetical protein